MAVVAYGRILPQAILDLAPLGCVNVHYSLLPRYRGAAPMQWAILEGEAVTGVSTMQLVAEMDAGPGPAGGKRGHGTGRNRNLPGSEARSPRRAAPDGDGRGNETGYSHGAPPGPRGRHLCSHAQEGGRNDRLGSAGPGDRATGPGLYPLALGIQLLGGQAGSRCIVRGRWRRTPRRRRRRRERCLRAGRGRHPGRHRGRRAAPHRAATGKAGKRMLAEAFLRGAGPSRGDAV